MNFWDTKSNFYDLVRRFPVLRQIYDTELAHLRKLLPATPAGLHLDLGTGTGSAFHALDISPAFTVISDLSPQMLLRARRRLMHPGVQLNSDAPLPFRSGTFDLITAVGLFEYVRDPVAFFREVYRIGSEQAVFLFTTTPPGLPALARAATWALPHACTAQEVRRRLEQAAWRVDAHLRSFMQEQWRCTKNAATREENV